jgi:hypothetical protein
VRSPDEFLEVDEAPDSQLNVIVRGSRFISLSDTQRNENAFVVVREPAENSQSFRAELIGEQHIVDGPGEWRLGKNLGVHLIIRSQGQSNGTHMNGM